MRDFEKISYEQFCKDVAKDPELYEKYQIPMRESRKTAGYDFALLKDLVLEPGEIAKIPTGVKAYYEDDEMLMLVVRSSTGFKYNIRLVNQVGIIDADYYNNKDNEGHIFIKVQNEGPQRVEFKAGEAIVQGIFCKYLPIKSDHVLDLERGSEY